MAVCALLRMRRVSFPFIGRWFVATQYILKGLLISDLVQDAIHSLSSFLSEDDIHVVEEARRLGQLIYSFWSQCKESLSRIRFGFSGSRLSSDGRLENRLNGLFLNCCLCYGSRYLWL